jgi:hypothetical protein
MSILDRKRRKYIKESLNKRNKKNLKESFEVVERYKEKYPDLFEGLKDKTLYDLYGNINKDIDGIIE